MVSKAEMSAQALVCLLGNALDGDMYERGRKDVRKAFEKRKDPEYRKEKRDEIKRILENSDYRKRPGPSYWIGCLAEIDFV